LAIFYERHAKDKKRALEFAHLALSQLRRARSRSRDSLARAKTIRMEQGLVKRIIRLQKRAQNAKTASMQPLL